MHSELRLAMTQYVGVVGAVNAFGSTLPGYCIAAGIPVFTSRGFRFRRLMSDTLLEDGTSLVQYTAFMGHTPSIALKHYAKACPKSLPDTVKRLGLGIPKRTVIPFPIEGADD